MLGYLCEHRFSLPMYPHLRTQALLHWIHNLQVRREAEHIIWFVSALGFVHEEAPVLVAVFSSRMPACISMRLAFYHVVSSCLCFSLWNDLVWTLRYTDHKRIVHHWHVHLPDDVTDSNNKENLNLNVQAALTHHALTLHCPVWKIGKRQSLNIEWKKLDSCRFFLKA